MSKRTPATKRASDRAPPKDQNSLEIAGANGKTVETRRAEVAYDPAVRSLAGARGFIQGMLGAQGLTESLEVLNAQVKEVQGGDLSGIERTLVAQANTLDAIFNELASRAARNMGEYLNATETYLRLALKAQTQCRATLETLAAIKNPPIIYARQANVTTGPQQVNNTIAPNTRTRETENTPTQLLEAQHGERLDSRTTGTASGSDPAMAALGTGDRAKVPRG